MSGLDLNILKRNKEAVLKAEIVSMLALWKKISPEADINKTNKNINNIDWQNLINNMKITFKDRNDNEVKSFDIWSNFLSEWRDWRKKSSKDYDYLLQILYGVSESLNSGVDKGSPKENVKVEPEYERWLANAFGSFKRKIIYLEKSETEINKLIDEIKNKVIWVLNKAELSLNDLEDIRNKIKELLSGLLSDDRFPINDVSLWEQTYMPTSMFKALLSNYVLTHSDFNEIPDRQKVKWRILGIQYDKVGIAEKSLKLASISWYREITKKIDEEIKNLLEIEYPIGNEVYRDETGIYFIVGEDLGKDLENGNLAEFKLKDLEEKILEIFKELTDDEFYPTIFLTKASRGLMNLSTLLENAKENFLKTNWKKKNISLSLVNPVKGKAIGICPICQVRLIYEEDKQKQDKTTFCEVCDDRIHHKQVSRWIDNLTGETIWIDEVKDKNNRITYISLKFELEDWLNGNLLNSLLTQQILESFEDLKQDTKNLLMQNKKINEGKIKNYIWGIPKSLKLKQLVENWLLERSIGQSWEEFIYKQLNDWDKEKDEPKKQKIDFERRKIYWNKLNDEDIDLLATLLLQFLLRKNPSPARLRRIWETTREFFEEIHKELDTILDIPEWRKKRLVWEVELDGENKLEKSMELEENGLLFWAEKEENKIYLISSIQDFLEKFGNEKIKTALKKIYEKSIKPEEYEKNLNLLNESFSNVANLKNYLNNKKITLKPYEEKENEKNKIEFDIKENLENIITYKPFTSITDPSPVNYQVIIPAEYLPNLIDKVLEKYNKEFKYVYGKLPIHIGVVISDYQKPLYINLKALRRIRRDVKEIDELYENKAQKEFQKYFRHKIIFYGDKENKEKERKNQTKDFYSLYWNKFKEGDYNFYIKPSLKLNKDCSLKWKKWLVSVDKLKSKFKTVQIIPNTFDFEYLDHNIRRNEIFYDEKGKRVTSLKRNRPYELEVYWRKFKAFKELFTQTNLQTSRLHKLIEILYSKVQYEESFNEDYSYLFASSFINWLELNKKENIERIKLIKKIFDLQADPETLSEDFRKELTEKLKNKENILLFIDMFEFWHTALKEV